MRVLVLLLALLLSMPVLAADYDYTPWPDTEQSDGAELLAQAAPGGNSQGGSPQGGGMQQSPRYPGDYCCRHCRSNEIPCGDKCLSKTGGKTAICTEKRTCACSGKP